MPNRKDLEFRKFDSRGNVKIAIQDQFTEIIDLLLGQVLDTITLLANTTQFDTSIDVETTGAHVPVAGNNVCLKEGTAFYQQRILTVTPIAGNQYTLDLDTPLDFAFTTAGGCSVVNTNIAVNGSVTPQIFAVSPALLNKNIQWDLTRMIGNMIHTSTPDDGTFGGIGALTNGIFFRLVNGTVKNGFNAKTNGDLALRMFDVQYPDAAPAGQNGTRFRRSFNGLDKNGVTIRLVNDENPDNADQFQLVVQDDLSGLTSFEVVVQGQVVDIS